jgi:phytoene synthase
VVADAAYAACFRVARQHAENFPVASWLLPASARRHVAAVYAFARLADDIADEGHRPPAERLRQLADWRRRLHEAAAGRADERDRPAGLIFTALAATIRTCALDVRLLDDLLSAFEQDVHVSRYETWHDVLDYCRRSANPVGRLVLQITGNASDARNLESDAVCTALQLTNFWQDLAVDWRRGRLYVPAEIVRLHGADTADLDAGRLTPPWHAALLDVADRTRRLFERGRGVATGVRGRLRWELRATWAGGMRALQRTEAIGFDVFRHRPSLGWRDAAPIAWHTIVWRRTSRAVREAGPPLRR